MKRWFDALLAAVLLALCVFNVVLSASLSEWFFAGVWLVLGFLMANALEKDIDTLRGPKC